MSSRYSTLPAPKPDPVIALGEEADRVGGMNVVIGAYRDESGKPKVLDVVKAAEAVLLAKINSGEVNVEYQPIEGDRHFTSAAVKLLLGQDFNNMDCVAAAQSLGGTGACRVAAAVFAAFLDASSTTVLISNPTWANHRPIFEQSGFRNVGTYRYFKPETKGVDIAGMLEDLTKAKDESVVVLHMCAHNPTGADPTKEDWEKIADVVQSKKHYVLFDGAYQGYATGDLEADAAPARMFYRREIEFFTAQSFSKNMGLYGERVGCLSAVCRTHDAAAKVEGLMKTLIRSMYSNPPSHGSRIATLILTDDKLRHMWYAELKGMANRILQMRTALFDALVALGTPGDWSHIKKQIGMFSYLGLTEPQSLALRKRKIYILATGRVSMAGLTADLIPAFSQGIYDVVTGALTVDTPASL